MKTRLKRVIYLQMKYPIVNIFEAYRKSVPKLQYMGIDTIVEILKITIEFIILLEEIV